MVQLPIKVKLYLPASPHKKRSFKMRLVGITALVLKLYLSRGMFVIAVENGNDAAKARIYSCMI